MLMISIVIQGSGYIRGFNDISVCLLGGRLLLLLLLGRLAALKWHGGRRWMMPGKACM
jgi:hypothetical protein